MHAMAAQNDRGAANEDEHHNDDGRRNKSRPMMPLHLLQAAEEKRKEVDFSGDCDRSDECSSDNRRSKIRMPRPSAASPAVVKSGGALAEYPSDGDGDCDDGEGDDMSVDSKGTDETTSLSRASSASSSSGGAGACDDEEEGGLMQLAAVELRDDDPKGKDAETGAGEASAQTAAGAKAGEEWGNLSYPPPPPRGICRRGNRSFRRADDSLSSPAIEEDVATQRAPLATTSPHPSSPYRRTRDHHVEAHHHAVISPDCTDPASPTASTALTETHQQQPLVLFGCNLTHLPPTLQFVICASGVFGFTIVYGCLQELLAVTIAHRKCALFLAVVQFAGYAFWSWMLTLLHRRQDQRRQGRGHRHGKQSKRRRSSLLLPLSGMAEENKASSPNSASTAEPWRAYLGLSLLRAVDLGMTNLAMTYLNYPAKTLIKSSRVVFTMILGLVVGNKRYRSRDYAAVALLVSGLAIFLHADASSNVVFHPLGVLMLVTSLTCDGTLNNWSELIMNRYAVSQDEFQLRLYSIALLAMTVAAHLKGELVTGYRYFFVLDGTVGQIEAAASSSGDEMNDVDDDDWTWTVPRKILVLLLFSTTGLFGSSCAGAITKRFGALTMSVTSTARKATTLFLSFALFQNRCTVEHVVGMAVFLTALLMKALCARSRHAAAAHAAAAAGGVGSATAPSTSTTTMKVEGKTSPPVPSVRTKTIDGKDDAQDENDDDEDEEKEMRRAFLDDNNSHKDDDTDSLYRSTIRSSRFASWFLRGSRRGRSSSRLSSPSSSEAPAPLPRRYSSVNMDAEYQFE